MEQRVQDVPPFARHSPDQERPLGGYAALMAIFAAIARRLFGIGPALWPSAP
jgi:hypothetical protein